jgi:hypothetical protein
LVSFKQFLVLACGNSLKIYAAEELKHTISLKFDIWSMKCYENGALLLLSDKTLWLYDANEVTSSANPHQKLIISAKETIAKASLTSQFILVLCDNTLTYYDIWDQREIKRTTQVTAFDSNSDNHIVVRSNGSIHVLNNAFETITQCTSPASSESKIKLLD